MASRFDRSGPRKVGPSEEREDSNSRSARGYLLLSSPRARDSTIMHLIHNILYALISIGNLTLTHILNLMLTPER